MKAWSCERCGSRKDRSIVYCRRCVRQIDIAAQVIDRLLPKALAGDVGAAVMVSRALGMQRAMSDLGSRWEWIESTLRRWPRRQADVERAVAFHRREFFRR